MRTIDCGREEDIRISDAQLREVVEELRDGNLVVYPTETVYGIGANIYDENAVKKVYLAKNRPFDMPLSVAVSDLSMMEEIAQMDDDAYLLAEKFLPGPLTIIIKKRPDVPDIVTAMSQKVGIRIPDHPLALRLIREFGPIVATSANKHSRPDAVALQEAVDDLGDMVSTYLDCGTCALGAPSTIVWLMDGEVEIIRQGAISREEIEAVLNE